MTTLKDTRRNSCIDKQCNLASGRARIEVSGHFACWRISSTMHGLVGALICCAIVFGLCGQSGCRARAKPITFFNKTSPVLEALEVKYQTEQHGLIQSEIAAPRTNQTELHKVTWNLSLDEAIRIAMGNAEVLRSLGAVVISNPQSATGVLDPAIQSSDPLFGTQAALSQFDTQLSSSVFYSKNDDVFNNVVLGGGAAEVRDDVAKGALGLRKTNGMGTQFSIQNNIQNSDSNNRALLFPQSWTTEWEGTVRQPLLQGSGLLFNQIAGPTTQPGFRFSNGVALSRINTEISIAQFERGVRSMVREIADTYWQLNLAYERLESTKRVRDLGWATWQAAKARYDQGLPGGGADQEALARAQYLQFESLILNDISGNSSSGQTGLLQAEANLRRLLGLPQSDDRLIRPIDIPTCVPMTYDWPSLASQASNSRVETREQLIRVKQREMQLIASRNFLLPRLDLLATYRANGFGEDLFGGSGRFSSAFKDMASNDHGEAEFGMTYDYTIGLRRAQAAVKNAELLLRRERAVLDEQQEQIHFEVGNALRAVYRSQADFELQSMRLEAAKTAVQAREAAFKADTITMDQLLESHQRLLDAERAYFDALLAIQIAHTRLSFESGRLLNELAVNLEYIDG